MAEATRQRSGGSPRRVSSLSPGAVRTLLRSSYECILGLNVSVWAHGSFSESLSPALTRFTDSAVFMEVRARPRTLLPNGRHIWATHPVVIARVRPSFFSLTSFLSASLALHMLVHSLCLSTDPLASIQRLIFFPERAREGPQEPGVACDQARPRRARRSTLLSSPLTLCP